MMMMMMMMIIIIIIIIIIINLTSKCTIYETAHALIPGS